MDGQMIKAVRVLVINFFYAFNHSLLVDDGQSRKMSIN